MNIHGYIWIFCIVNIHNQYIWNFFSFNLILFSIKYNGLALFTHESTDQNRHYCQYRKNKPVMLNFDGLNIYSLLHSSFTWLLQNHPCFRILCHTMIPNFRTKVPGAIWTKSYINSLRNSSNVSSNCDIHLVNTERHAFVDFQCYSRI